MIQIKKYYLYNENITSNNKNILTEQFLLFSYKNIEYYYLFNARYIIIPQDHFINTKNPIGKKEQCMLHPKW